MTSLLISATRKPHTTLLADLQASQPDTCRIFRHGSKKYNRINYVKRKEGLRPAR